MPLFIFCDFHNVTDINAQCTANSHKHIEPYILVFCPDQVEEKYIATMGFEYVNVPKLDEIRLKNPLGFTVKSYRIDKDGI